MLEPNKHKRNGFSSYQISAAEPNGISNRLQEADPLPNRGFLSLKRRNEHLL